MLFGYLILYQEFQLTLELSSECFLVEYSAGLLQRQLVREILKKSLVYVPAFEPSALINVPNPKVQTNVLCKCIGLL